MTAFHGRVKLADYFRSVVFKRFIRSYLFALLIPVVLLFAFLYMENLRVLEQEVYRLQSTYLSHIQRTLDSAAQRYGTYADVLSGNEDIVQLYRQPHETMTASDMLRIRKLRSDLASYTASDSAINRSLIYLSKSDLLVDTSRALSAEDVTELLAETGILPDDPVQWQRFYSSYHRGNWYSFVNSRGEAILYYAHTVATLLDRNEVCNLIIVLKSGFVADVLRPMEHDDGWVGLYAADGTLLFGQGSENPPDQLPDSIPRDERGQQLVDGILYSYYRSGQTDSWLVSALPEHSIRHALKGARNLAISIFAVCLCLCAAIVYVTTVHNYRPIAQLANMVPEGEDDEYIRLRLALIDAADVRQKLLHHNLFAQRAQADERLIQQLSTPDAGSAIAARVREEGIPATGNCWALSVVTLIDYTDSENNLSELLMLLSEFFSSFAIPPYAILPLISKGCLNLLLNAPTSESHHVTWYQTTFQTALQFLRDNYALDCKVGVSALHDCQQGFSWHHMQQEIQLAYELLSPGNSILCYDILRKDTVQRIAVEHTMTRLMNAALNGDEEQSQRLLAALVDQTQTLVQHTARAERIDHVESEGSDLRLKRRIVEIVQDEYPNPMLNVSYIADKLGKNVDYISRVFKAVTTVGLLDYIHHVRVKAAKDILLDNPSLPISKVATLTGYVGADSLIRAFKRIEGTTPGKYRDTLEGGRRHASES